MKQPSLKFCISHCPPLLPDHLYDYAIGLGRYTPVRGAHISAIDGFWGSMRMVSYGAAGTHAVARAIDNHDDPPVLTGVFTYRRVVTRSGASCKRHPGKVSQHFITIEESKNIRVEDVHPSAGHDFLVSRPTELTVSVAEQYITGHHALDFYEYCSIAVEVGILTMEQVQELSTGKILIPGGCELGMYPTAWLRNTLDKLIAVGREFVTRNYYRILTYDKVQARALSFLAERLGSYYLHKELCARYPDQIPEEVFGDLCVVVEQPPENRTDRI